MPTEVNNRPIRRRGGKFAKSLRRDVQGMLDTGSTSKVVAEGKRGYIPAMNVHFLGVETPETHIIPRKSVTKAQHLVHKDQVLEFEALKPTIHTQVDNKGNTVITTDPNSRVVWKSDKSLLNRSKVDQFGEGSHGTLFKRETSRTKRKVIEAEIKTNLDNQIHINKHEIENPGIETETDLPFEI